MISVNSVNIIGESQEKVKLSEVIFGVKPKTSVLSQAVRVFLSNQRTARAKTKTRSEVAKTTAKMFKQKGTGRARHGSYSAPIFVGGGIAHGPTGTQNYKLSLNDKVGKISLFQALSLKAGTGKLVILSANKDEKIKTKDAQKFISSFKVKGKILMITSSSEINLNRAFRNIENVEVSHTEQLNAYLVLNSVLVAFTKDSIGELEKLFAVKK